MVNLVGSQENLGKERKIVEKFYLMEKKKFRRLKGKVKITLQDIGGTKLDGFLCCWSTHGSTPKSNRFEMLV